MGVLEDIDHTARCYVQGTKKHSRTGQIIPVCCGWHERFRGHPWVEQSISEGWDGELRMHIVREVKLRLINAQLPPSTTRRRDLSDIESLMPDAKFVEGCRKMAERYRLAFEWQEAHPAKSMGSVTRLTRDVSRKAFSDWQRETSQTADARARHSILSDISKRMTGERD